jgi:hypothetical protein
MSGRLVREPCAPPPALPGRLVLELCRNNGPATESKEVQPKAKSAREATSSFVTRYQQKKTAHTYRCHGVQFENEARRPPAVSQKGTSIRKQIQSD